MGGEVQVGGGACTHVVRVLGCAHVEGSGLVLKKRMYVLNVCPETPFDDDDDDELGTRM